MNLLLGHFYVALVRLIHFMGTGSTYLRFHIFPTAENIYVIIGIQTSSLNQLWPPEKGR